MATYSGYYQFTNFTGETIVKGHVNHWTTEYGINGPIEFTNLADGDSTDKVDLKTDSSSKDHWSVDIQTSSGTRWHCPSKECGFEEEDADGTVVLSITQGDGEATFMVKMPVSSNCDTNLKPAS